MWFSVALLAALGFAVQWAGSQYGEAGIRAAFASWLVVTLGSGVALAISILFCRTPHSSSANMFGMLPRLAAPLVGLIGLKSGMAGWDSSGGAAVLLGSYFVALAIETWVTVRFLCPLAPPACGVKSVSSSKPLGV